MEKRDPGMKVMILCGGQGARLREETEYRPKPLVEVGGRPILWHIMKIYATHGFMEFVLCLGYRGTMIKEYFLNYETYNNDFTIHLGRKNIIAYDGAHDEQDYRITLVDTGQATMTGGRVLRAKRFICGDSFMVTYGDGLIDLDIGRLVAFHQSHGRLATITTVRPQSRFGVLNLKDDGQVAHFEEKPRLDGWVSAGYMVFNRGVFDYLDGDECVLEQAPLQRLAADGQLMSYRHEGFFFAMDTYRDYLEINQLWQGGRPPWKVWS